MQNPIILLLPLFLPEFGLLPLFFPEAGLLPLFFLETGLILLFYSESGTSSDSVVFNIKMNDMAFLIKLF